jgi:hypothetical protein
MEIGMSIYTDDYISKNTPKKYKLGDLYKIVISDRFEENVKKSANAPFSEIMTITPEDAKKILSNNQNNRTVNQTLIKTIANDILSERWMLNGESIIISKDGELNDGQHRLLAIILAKKSIETLVFFGADRGSRITVDMGRPRTVANLLSMDNVQNYNSASAIARMYYQYRCNKYQDGGSFVSATKQQIRQEYFDHREKIDDALKLVGHQKFSNLIGVTPMCTSYIAIGDVNTKNREEFFFKLISGENIRAGNPILKAREHLIDMKSKRTTAPQRMEVIFRYWNAWRRGITMQRACSIYNEWPELEA